MAAFVYDMADTWNNGGTTFAAIKMNVTNTASAADSKLLDLQVGSSTKFNVAPNGSTTIIGDSVAVSAPILDLSQTWNAGGVIFSTITVTVTNTASADGSKILNLVSGTQQCYYQPRSLTGATNESSLVVEGTDLGRTNLVLKNNDGHTFEFSSTGSGNAAPNTFGIYDRTANKTYLALAEAGNSFHSTAYFGWASGAFPPSGVDLTIYRDAAHTLAQRNGTNAQTFRVYNTFTNSSNYERARLAWESNTWIMGPEKEGAGSSRGWALTDSSNNWIFNYNSGNGTLNAAIELVCSAPLGANHKFYVANGAKTIASGAISAPNTTVVTVDTEAAAASDDLDTITADYTWQIIILRAANDARTVVAKDGTGNLKLAGDFSLDNTEDTLMLIYNGSNWLELSRSDNTA